MKDNYKPIRQFIDRLLREYYQSVEKDLEEIINAPSLLARTSKYYRLFHDDGVCLLVFVYGGEIWIVKEWIIDKFQEYMRTKQKLELWCESNLSIIHSDPIMYQGGCGETYRRGQLLKLDNEIKKTIKDLDTYDVNTQIRLSKKLVKLFEMKNLLLKL